MHRKFLKLALLACAAAVFAVAAPDVSAQRGVGQGRGKQSPPPKQQQEQRQEARPQQPPAKNDRRGNPNRQTFRGRPDANLPMDWENRLRNLSPEARERWFQNNERFRQLPPDRQQELRNRLRTWSNLSPEEQRAIRERERVWAGMSREQQRRVRQEIFPRWQRLPPDRKQGLVRRLRVLRDLPEDQRQARLADPRFVAGLDDNERELLGELSRLRIGPGAQDDPPL